MKIDVVPENLLERLALRAGLVPRPFLQTILAAEMARGGLRRVTLEMLGKARALTATTRSEEVAVLSGLASGRFKLSFSSVLGREASVEKDVELDGVHDLELEYDLR